MLVRFKSHWMDDEEEFWEFPDDTSRSIIEYKLKRWKTRNGFGGVTWEKITPERILQPATKSFKLSQAVINELSPGIKDAVIWLNEMGFRTTDSGDGDNYYEEGMECAWPFPMVAMRVDSPMLVSEAERLFELIKTRNPHPLVQIEASYNPNDGVALIVLWEKDGRFLTNLGKEEQ